MCIYTVYIYTYIYVCVCVFTFCSNLRACMTGVLRPLHHNCNICIICMLVFPTQNPRFPTLSPSMIWIGKIILLCDRTPVIKPSVTVSSYCPNVIFNKNTCVFFSNIRYVIFGKCLNQKVFLPELKLPTVLITLNVRVHHATTLVLR